MLLLMLLRALSLSSKLVLLFPLSFPRPPIIAAGRAGSSPPQQPYVHTTPPLHFRSTLLTNSYRREWGCRLSPPVKDTTVTIEVFPCPYFRSRYAALRSAGSGKYDGSCGAQGTTPMSIASPPRPPPDRIVSTQRKETQKPRNPRG